MDTTTAHRDIQDGEEKSQYHYFEVIARKVI